MECGELPRHGFVKLSLSQCVDCDEDEEDDGEEGDGCDDDSGGFGVEGFVGGFAGVVVGEAESRVSGEAFVGEDAELAAGGDLPGEVVVGEVQRGETRHGSDFVRDGAGEVSLQDTEVADRRRNFSGEEIIRERQDPEAIAGNIRRKLAGEFVVVELDYGHHRKPEDPGRNRTVEEVISNSNLLERFTLTDSLR
ncbi:Receptor protein kinase CLAVATA1 [Senna tora]|uniref:Receptor protein kinase CLAVATA1 n=1 Tax=Senna tora TaxID=362788 RepID=A0A834WJ40_9FABA|nr:Receptor protein kinase CLAVATA1 [Senna tora]